MIAFTLAIKTTNPNNGATGNSKLAAIIRGRARKTQRQAAWAMTLAMAGLAPTLPCTVVLTRVAPSGGLDPHDGLGAALKGVIDGVADGLGLANDRDERVTWVLTQRRGSRKQYAVEVRIESQAKPDCGPVSKLTQVPKLRKVDRLVIAGTVAPGLRRAAASAQKAWETRRRNGKA